MYKSTYELNYTVKQLCQFVLYPIENVIILNKSMHG